MAERVSRRQRSSAAWPSGYVSGGGRVRRGRAWPAGRVRRIPPPPLVPSVWRLEMQMRTASCKEFGCGRLGWRCVEDVGFVQEKKKSCRRCSFFTVKTVRGGAPAEGVVRLQYRRRRVLVVGDLRPEKSTRASRRPSDSSGEICLPPGQPWGAEWWRGMVCDGEDRGGFIQRGRK